MPNPRRPKQAVPNQLARLYGNLRIHAFGKRKPGQVGRRVLRRVPLKEAQAEFERLLERGKGGDIRAVRGLIEVGIFYSEFDVKARAFEIIGEIGEHWRNQGVKEAERQGLRKDLVDIAFQQSSFHPGLGYTILKAAEKMTGKPIDPATEGFHPEGFGRSLRDM